MHHVLNYLQNFENYIQGLRGNALTIFFPILTSPFKIKMTNITNKIMESKFRDSITSLFLQHSMEYKQHLRELDRRCYF